MNIRKEKAQLTKEKIINAAEVLLNNQSFDEISVDDIVKYANVAKGTFYIYFKKKSMLYMKKGSLLLKSWQKKFKICKMNQLKKRYTHIFKVLLF